MTHNADLLFGELEAEYALLYAKANRGDALSAKERRRIRELYVDLSILSTEHYERKRMRDKAADAEFWKSFWTLGLYKRMKVQ